MSKTDLPAPRPKLIAISAPSGAGKTTIARALLQKHPEILFSVSATTRPKRDGEQEGVDYFFIPVKEFEQMIETGELVEWEKIYGDYYGTLRREVKRALDAGHSMLFDIDVKGALSIRRAYPNHALLIFIQPPSIETLTKRLTARKTESEERIQKRLARVPMELERAREFDHRIINDSLDRAIEEAEQIVHHALYDKDYQQS